MRQGRPARRNRLYGVLACGVALALLCGGIRYWPRAPLAAQFASSVAIYDLRGDLLRLTLSSDEKYRLWTPLTAIAPEIVAAFLLHEDQHFYRHPGINPIALARGAFRTYVSAEPRQGGSTITMQLARLSARLNTRTPAGKFAQIGHALALELRYSKREILEAYLNLVPFGANVEGVGAASLAYFGKPPVKLALSEALALAVIPQSPTRRMLTRSNTAGLQAARERLAARWHALHPEAFESAALSTLALNLRSPVELPFRAPHLTTTLAAHHQPGESNEIRSTLDPALQATLERVLRQHVTRHQRIGVRNAAALLLDARSMEVRALVGSADFRDAAIDGQVNGVLAKRSPGSTLKPFVYALAIDQGHIHPLSVLKDAPTSFGTFGPENFDNAFMGPLSATDALNRSRNIPAVALAAQLTHPNLRDFLAAGGVTRLAPERHYGLALALGAAEVSMAELATLYASLANRGVVAPLRYRVDAPLPRASTRILSEESAFMVLEMLRAHPRPEGAIAGIRGGAPVAWKTGTSWGFRDAWSAGVFGPYVLVVWVGNFDGSANPAFVGGKIAAPLFFNIVNAVSAISPGLTDPNPHPPMNLIRLDVCAASGDLPNADCPRLAQTWFAPGRSPIRVSSVHRRLPIDVRSGLLACANTDQKLVRDELFEVWPSDLMRVFAQAGLPRREVPPMGACDAADSNGDSSANDGANSGTNNGTKSSIAGVSPSIISPLAGAVYSLHSDSAEPAAISLSASVDGGVRTLYWFVNTNFVGASGPDKPLTWRPRAPGRYVVRVLDEHGRGAAREFAVAATP